MSRTCVQCTARICVCGEVGDGVRGREEGQSTAEGPQTVIPSDGDRAPPDSL